MHENLSLSVNPSGAAAATCDPAMFHVKTATGCTSSALNTCNARTTADPPPPPPAPPLSTDGTASNSSKSRHLRAVSPRPTPHACNMSRTPIRSASRRTYWSAARSLRRKPGTKSGRANSGTPTIEAAAANRCTIAPRTSTPTSAEISHSEKQGSISTASSREPLEPSAPGKTTSSFFTKPFDRRSRCKRSCTCAFSAEAPPILSPGVAEATLTSAQSRISLPRSTLIGSSTSSACAKASRIPPSWHHDAVPDVATLNSTPVFATTTACPKACVPTARGRFKACATCCSNRKKNSSDPFESGRPCSPTPLSSSTSTFQPPTTRAEDAAAAPACALPLGFTPSSFGCKPRGIRHPRTSRTANKCKGPFNLTDTATAASKLAAPSTHKLSTARAS